MKAGVWTTPWGVSNSPSRAPPSVRVNAKRNELLKVKPLIMAAMKLRVGVIYGGRSGEHEVSVVSAASIFKHLDRSRFQPVPIRIDKDGRWVLGAKEPTAISAGDVQDSGPVGTLQVTEPTAAIGGGIDVVFPVLHGPYGEDGTVQGLLELANVPYVGAGVLGSALGMDKAVSKTVFAAHGLPIVPYVTVTAREWETTPQEVTSRVGTLRLSRVREARQPRLERRDLEGHLRR